MEVLIIEDEAGIASLIRTCIEADGHSCTIANSGQHGIQLFQRKLQDVVILDVGLPDMNGLEVCTAIRQMKAAKYPIIFILSARRSISDRIVGYSSGADDYIEKPFNPQELPVRLRAVARRFAQATPLQATGQAKLIQTNHLLIDQERREVMLQRCGGSELQSIDLSSLEFELLFLLASKPGRIWSRSELLDAVRGEDFIGDERAINSCIKRLRAKINPDAQRDRFIKTKRNCGYSFEDSQQLCQC